MLSTPRRIIDTAASARPLSTWLAGLAVGMLGIGAYGVSQPLLPVLVKVVTISEDDVPIMDFQPAAEAPSAETAVEPPPAAEPEIEIPPLPEMVPPLTPPEVPELQPIETPPPAPMPMVKPPELKPTPKPVTKPSATPRSTSAASTSTGSSTTPTLFSGGGTGRFPSPAYPASARSSRQQGTVRLLVTVEASGLPSSVEVQTSSGFGALDSAARDHLRRRWRWPAGAVRRYIVPIRFTLQ